MIVEVEHSVTLWLPSLHILTDGLHFSSIEEARKGNKTFFSKQSKLSALNLLYIDVHIWEEKLTEDGLSCCCCRCYVPPQSFTGDGDDTVCDREMKKSSILQHHQMKKKKTKRENEESEIWWKKIVLLKSSILSRLRRLMSFTCCPPTHTYGWWKSVVSYGTEEMMFYVNWLKKSVVRDRERLCLGEYN